LSRLIGSDFGQKTMPLHLLVKTLSPMFRTLVYTLIIISLSTACQSKTESALPGSDVNSLPPQIERAAAEPTPEAPQAAPSPKRPDSPTAPESPTPAVTRQIIRNATLRFRVGSQTESEKHIALTVKQFGGIITSEEQTRDNGNLQTNLTVRVPAARLDTFLTVVLRESIFTDTKQITAEDVTKQFVDVQARIRSQKATEARYLELLKRARNVAEVIEVENQLRQMREEIEMREAELRELKNDVAMSTVTLTYYEETEAADSPQDGWLARLGRNLLGGVELIGSFFLGVAYVLPLLLLVGVPAWLLIRWWRNRKKGN
jgi:Domain of unknown function (DUF4349)